MAFLNSAALLNLGADAVKTAAASQVSQESQASGSDEFAQALRKQMQQGNKPAIPVANQADAPKPVETAEKTPSASTPASNNSVKNDNAPQKTAHQTDEKQPAEATASNEPAPAQAEAVESKEASAVAETPQERKKRLLADLAANDQLPTGISPWMQTMIAMRPATTTSGTQPKAELNSDSAAASVSGVGAVADSKLLPEMTEHALPLNAESAGTASVPASAGTATPASHEDTGIDFKQLLTETSQASTGNEPVGNEAAGLPETLVNAKLMAESRQDTGRAAPAFGEMRTDAQSDVFNMVSQPAAQALPNSQWLNAAGVAQSSSVVMSQIAAPFGNERWQTAMNQHVMKMVGSGDDVASLTLSPPDLGPIQVVLKVDNQSVNTSFITDNPLVRQALEDGMQDLRDRMQSQGLQLGQTFVGDGQQAQQHFEQQTARQGGPSLGTTGEADTQAAPQTAVRTTVARGLVDTFV